ncbi:MAG: hypothetical protein ACPGVK_07895 [Halocynthiibacter sp.]
MKQKSRWMHWIVTKSKSAKFETPWEERLRKMSETYKKTAA